MRSLGALLSCAALALAGCGELPVVDAGQCGNAVVELGAGEDCDRFATAPGSVCRAPGEAEQCRYDCSLREDGTRPACPPAMGCALDGVCRWASGSYDNIPTSIPAAPRELLTADMDGDRRLDLIVAERDRTVVRYFADQVAPDAELVIPALSDSGVLPVAGDLSGDALPDLVVPYSGGVIGSLGAADRSLLPTAYPTLSLPEDVNQVYYLALEVLPQLPGEEVLLLATTTGGKVGGIVYVTSEFAVENLTATFFPPSQLAGAPPVGKVDEDPVTSPCDELVLPYRDVDRVFVFSPCKLDAVKGIVLNENGVGKTTLLPEGDVIVGPTALLDLNHDAHLDLALVASDGKANFIAVAYGIGDGSFSSLSPVPSTGDGKAAHAGDLGDKAPLALGDLDADGAVDFVDGHGVYRHGVSGWEVVASSGADTWSEAVIADLNGNGLPDVFAAVAGRAGATFLNGAGDGFLSSFEVPSDGALAHLRVDDFDGDLLKDVAASQTSGKGSADFLTVMFGQITGAPTSPRRMGLVDKVIQVGSSRASIPGEPPWAVDDIITLSLTPEKETAFAGFGGRGDRRLRSPYTVVKTEGSGSNVKITGYAPRRLAVGRFDGDSHLDLTELAQRRTPAGTFAEILLWLIPMTDQARVRLSDARASAPLPDGADLLGCEMASGDLDGDGTDELVLLAPKNGGSSSLGFVAHSEDPGDGHRRWVLGEPVALDFRFEHREAIELPGGEAGGGRLRIADIDADGDADVVALSPASAGGPAAVVVFFGTGKAELGPPTVIPAVPAGEASAFASIQADRDPELELLVLAGGRVHLADLTAPATWEVSPAPLVELLGAETITAGDLDGDGVADLALGTPSSVQVFRGIPGLR